jgi:signal transduction histidine kinase
VLVLLAATRWVDTGPLAPERYRRVVGWCVGGAVGFLLVNLAILLSLLPFAALWVVRWLLFAAVSGAVGGVLVGVTEARAVQRAVEHQRAVSRAEQAEEHEAWLDYLNALLRHEVLNSANVVQGVSDVAREETDDPAVERWLEVIERRSDDLADVVRDVRVLIEASTDPDGDSLYPVDLGVVLDEQVERLRARHPEADVSLQMPEEVLVWGDDLQHRVFANVLANAVEHNPRAAPTVEVRVEREAETTAVHISDDGPGVDPAVRAALFERGTRGDHGVGLYLVSELVERYGGTVELATTGADGSTFVVTLPTASAASLGDDPSAPAAEGRPHQQAG